MIAYPFFRRIALALLVILSLAACGPSEAERQAAAQAAAAAAAEREAAQQQALFQQSIDGGNIEMAAAYGELILTRYPGTQAAAAIEPAYAKIKAQADAAKQQRRMQALWTYQTSEVGGGTQRTATIDSDDGGTPRVQLVLRQHTEWGLSVFLLPAADTFRCTQCTAQLRADDGLTRTIAVTKSTSKENPALFIDSEKGLLAALAKAQVLTLHVPVEGGTRTLRFEVGGYQPERFASP